ncbi:MAG: hypothetical protein CMM93_00980 [Rickettsiales bacterium]|nr:hypothetical protein [Rickettsiales bacterium]|tara:strand:+ start:535 stop:1674 length:1140 start_codon:yes stop_codon:yes gene_type:complete
MRVVLGIWIVSVAYCLLYLYLLPADSIAGDFHVFYRVSEQLWHGDISTLYTQSITYLRDGFPDLASNPFPYPPHAIVFTTPLSVAPFHWAYALWTLIGLTLLSLTLASPAARALYQPVWQQRWFRYTMPLWIAGCGLSFHGLVVGQSESILASLLLAGLLYRKHYPLLSGIAFGILTIKPHLGLLIPLLLIIEGNRRCFLSAALTTFALVGLSIAMFGAQLWYDYVQFGQSFAEALASEDNNMKQTMFSVLHAFWLVWHLPESLAYALHLGHTCLVIGVWYYCIKRSEGEATRLTLTLIANLLLSPYALTYNMLPLLLVALIYFAHATPATQVRHHAIAGALLFLPFLTMGMNNAGLPLTPWLLIGLMGYSAAQRQMLK